jgi:hypothetical protein
LTDPISGRTGGILQRARDAGVCPKVLHLDTESDFWQARSSLIATDPSGADIAMPEEVRIYTATGVSHAPFRPLTRPVMQLPGNRLGYGAFMRALLVALFEWVEHGAAPPDSRFPSRAAGTLVTLAEARRTFPRLPGVNFPKVLTSCGCATIRSSRQARAHHIPCSCSRRMRTAALSAAFAIRCLQPPWPRMSAGRYARAAMTRATCSLSKVQ